MRAMVRCGVLLACLIVPAAAQSGGAAGVRIDNFTFGPQVVVDKGTAVTWTNQDDIPHLVVLSAIGVRSKALDTDQSFTYRFYSVGRFAYVCGLHPQMRGEIVAK
ncbi:cupredoxin domain-containing protein [Rhodopila sp.]|uniref:cupredoxin domain-containing protein n=1 Tax=Rhodopila sp. TaxID=2480087 RepID=UPI003D14F4A1